VGSCSVSFETFLISYRYELQRRLNTDPTLSNISVIGLDPGWVSTAIGRNSPMNTAIIWTFQYLAPVLNYFWPNHYVRTATKTGDDLVRVCFDQEKFGEYPKALYVDGSEIEARMNEEARDEKKREKLWKGSLRYAGIKEYDTVLVGWK
jgi:hypothetical protein